MKKMAFRALLLGMLAGGSILGTQVSADPNSDYERRQLCLATCQGICTIDGVCYQIER